MRRWTVAGLALGAALLALALAGAGRDGPPPGYTPMDPSAAQPRPPSWYAYPDVGEQTYTVWAGNVVLDAASGHTWVDVTVPERNLQVLVNVTFVSGVTRDFGFAGLSDCAKRLSGPIVGDGTTIAFDCGNATSGAHEVLFSHAAGQITTSVEIVARVCPHGSSCAYMPRAG